MAMLLSHFDRPGFTYILRRCQLPVILGSGRISDIRLHDDSIGPLHCMIDRDGENWVVRDLATKSGTYVNGSRVAGTSLASGDRLTIGRTSLRVHIDPRPRPRKARREDREEAPLGAAG